MLFEFHSLFDIVHEFSAPPRTSYVRQLFVLTPIEAAQLVVGFRRNWPISPPIALCSRRLFVKQLGSYERDARRHQNVDALGWRTAWAKPNLNCRKQTEQCIMVEILRCLLIETTSMPLVHKGGRTTDESLSTGVLVFTRDGQTLTARFESKPNSITTENRCSGYGVPKL
jgi:hypothetical protein